jgi:hypothetical protein
MGSALTYDRAHGNGTSVQPKRPMSWDPTGTTIQKLQMRVCNRANNKGVSELKLLGGVLLDWMGPMNKGKHARDTTLLYPSEPDADLWQR